MDRSLVVLDTELASGRGAPHLVEVAAVRLVSGEIDDHFSSLVRPEVPVEEEAFDLHGLGEDELRSAPEPSEVLAHFLTWIGDDWLVAHHARSDASALAYGLARADLPRPENRFLDTLALARRTFPDAPDHRLGTLAEWLGIEMEREHRALPDAVTCAQVLDRCVTERGGWDVVSEEDLVAHGRSPVTLATGGPTEPRRNARVRALSDARQAGEQVAVLYGNGDAAPARVELTPQFLFRREGKDYLEAICASSGQWKTYRLDRVRRVLRSAGTQR